MDWEWDSNSHRKTQTGKGGIKKLKDEWIWQSVKLGPAGQYGGHQVGETLKDEVYPCGFCNGTGEKPRGSRCPVCRGKGTAFVESPAVKCAYCKGRGEEKPRGNVTCIACKGKGVIHVEEPIEICTHCRGTGKEVTNKLVCVKCRGKGVVTVKEEKETYDLEEEVDSFARGMSSQTREIKKEEPVGSASGSERDALEIVKKLGKADSMAVSRSMSPPVSSAYAHQLCSALVKKRLLIKDGILYSLTSYGEEVLS